MDIKYLSCKNKYGYAIKQLMIDYENRTYSVGDFKIMKANSTLKNINEKIQELSKLGFREVSVYEYSENI